MVKVSQLSSAAYKYRPLKRYFYSFHALRDLQGRDNISIPLGIDRSFENNIPTHTNKLNKIRKKFWQNITLNNEIDPKLIHIQMDSKTIKTPMGNKLVLKREQGLLAYLLKDEWCNLETLSSKSYSLPLTSLTSRCIDLESASTYSGELDPEATSKRNEEQGHIIKDLLRYLDTDTLLVFAPKDELEGTLRREQDELYLPIIKGIETLLYESIPKDSNFSKNRFQLRQLDCDTDGIRGNEQPQLVRKAAIAYLKSLSLWNLAVFEKTVMTTKSFICGILLCENSVKICPIPTLKCDVEMIARLASLETIHQTGKWGEVEDTHDVDKADLLRNISAASIVSFKG